MYVRHRNRLIFPVLLLLKMTCTVWIWGDVSRCPTFGLTGVVGVSTPNRCSFDYENSKSFFFSLSRISVDLITRALYCPGPKPVITAGKLNGIRARVPVTRKREHTAADIKKKNIYIHVRARIFDVLQRRAIVIIQKLLTWNKPEVRFGWISPVNKRHLLYVVRAFNRERISPQRPKEAESPVL